jgi:hypothetical protein
MSFVSAAPPSYPPNNVEAPQIINKGCVSTERTGPVIKNRIIKKVRQFGKDLNVFKSGSRQSSESSNAGHTSKMRQHQKVTSINNPAILQTG